MFKALNELRNNARESGIREAIKIMLKNMVGNWVLQFLCIISFAMLHFIL